MSHGSKGLLLGLLTPFILLAEDAKTLPKPDTSNLHAFAATGYAWSMNAGINNPQPGFWDASNEGYNSSLGNVSFFTLGFGYRCFEKLDVDFNYSFYDTFTYEKKQTSQNGQSGDVRMRYFNLDNQSALFNFSLFPYAISLGSLRTEIVPFIGLGLGVSMNYVSNFHTIGNDVERVGSTTSTGEPVTTIAFAWQGMGGFRIHPKNKMLSIDIAYRYYNGGTFKGPSTITSFADNGEDFTGKPLEGTLQTNQIYFAFNISM